jgi:hypothetical protein
VAAADVLDERVSSADHTGRAKPFEATHRPESGREPSVIGLIGLFLYCSMTWHAEGSNSSSTVGRPVPGRCSPRWGVSRAQERG